MTRVLLRDIWWATLLASLLALCSCSGVPAKSAAVVLPSTLPVRKSVAAVKTSTQASVDSAAASRDAIDRAIVQAHQAALAIAEQDFQKRMAPVLEALETAKKKQVEWEKAAETANADAAAAVKEAEVLRASQDKAATNALAQQEENEAWRNERKASEEWMGLHGVFIWFRYFFAHVLLWLAGFAVVLTALSFFVPAIGAFFSMVLTNLISLFKKR